MCVSGSCSSPISTQLYLFTAVSFTLLSALGCTLKRKICKLDRERWSGIQMKELVKERIYKEFTAVLKIFHDQNRILKKPHYPSALSSETQGLLMIILTRGYLNSLVIVNSQ